MKIWKKLNAYSYFLFIWFAASNILSAEDSCSFKSDPVIEDYTLSNGLRVVLIEDMEVEEAAGAVSCHVGCWDDPQEAPGMAHFVEHVLFMGTREYPQESQFHNFIHDRGGEMNAFTFYDRTVYGFSIDVEHFEDAAKHLGSFFVAPLFKDDSLRRESYAVHHEYLDQADDFFIHLWRILKQSGNPDHPNARLSVGNLTTLNPASSQVVQAWFEEHYSADNMQAVLIAPMPIKTLRMIADKALGQVPIRKRKNQSSEGKLFENLEGSIVHFHPPSEMRSLWLAWEVPADFHTQFPLNVFAETMQIPLQTGLGEILKRDHLAYDFQADMLSVDEHHSLFLFSAELTPNGLKHYDQVLRKIFGTIAYCKTVDFSSNWVENMIDKEMSQLHYRTPYDPFEFVLDFAGDWSQDPHPFLVSQDPRVDFKAALAWLDPSKAIYALSSPSGEAHHAINSVEQWLGSPFTIKKIDESVLENLKTQEPLKGIALPLTFCGYDNLRLFNDVECGESEEDPITVDHGENFLVQFEKTLFHDQHPPLSILALWEDPLLENNLKNQLLGEIHGRFLNEKILPGLDLEFPIALNFSGDSQDWFLEIHYFSNAGYSQVPKVFTTITHTVASPSEWQTFLQRAMELEKQRDSSFDQAINIGYAFWNHKPLIDLDRSQILMTLTYEDYLEFCRQAFKQGELSIDFIGSEEEKDVFKLWKQIASRITLPSGEDEDALEHTPFLSQSTISVHSKSLSHSAAFAFTAPWNTLEGDFFEYVLERIIRTEAFHALRTQKQLAYALFYDVEFYNKQMHFLVAMRSGLYPPEDLSHEIHQFMRDFFDHPEQFISRERFGCICDSILSFYRPRSGKKGRNYLHAMTYEDFCELLQSIVPFIETDSIEVQVQGRVL